MKILNFGSANLDYVYSVNHIVKPGETQTSDKLEVFPGGKGLNQSVALAKAGAEVYHAGCIGSDGDMLKDLLKKSGADVSYIKEVSGKNGHAVIQVTSDGENSIVLYPGSNSMITEEQIDEVLDNFAKGDIILLQNEINLVDLIIKKANARGLEIILNPSPYNEKLAEIDLDMISYLILNEVEAEQITGKTAPEEILDYFIKEYPTLKIMLTLGKNGCVYSDEKMRVYQPIFKTEAIDTTAAGDTFTGYFIAGLSEKMEMKEILKMASMASSIAVSKKGAAPSIPEKKEVLNEQKKRG